jgi:hypothetical protein
MIDLTDEELNRLRADTENNFVERKTISDKNGWVKTTVAFANSTPIGMPAVLFVGLNDDGTFPSLPPDHDWQKQEKTITQELKRIYPPIPVFYKIVRVGENQCIALIVPGSPERPHFTGKSWIRVGPETREASEEQFNQLIADRNSKAYEIRKWIGKRITTAQFIQGTLTSDPVTLISCNQHYFTISLPTTGEPGPDTRHSFPLNRTELSFNHQRNCLQLEIRDLP